MSARTRLKKPTRLPAATGTCKPARASKAANPTDLSSTVFPPALGPLTTRALALLRSEKADTAARRHRYVQTRARKQGGQPHRFEQHGFSASVGAADHQGLGLAQIGKSRHGCPPPPVRANPRAQARRPTPPI